MVQAEERHCPVAEAVAASGMERPHPPAAAPVRPHIPAHHNTDYTAAAGSLPIP